MTSTIINSTMMPFEGKHVVGLTGGIGSGKSTALIFFKDLGWMVISADKIVDQTLLENQAVRNEIRKRWGSSMFQSCGSIDKSAISGVIFTREAERLWIEELLHPIIRTSWMSFIQSCSPKKCMIELPLLFENKLQNYFSHTLSVFAPIHIMQDRLSKRGLSHSEANARISCQLSAEQKADLADYVLWGGGSEKFLLNQVENLNSTLN